MTGRLSCPSTLAQKLRANPFTIIVTGGSGWIGQAALEMLDDALGDELPKRVHVYGSHDSTLHLRSGRALPYHALARLNDLKQGPALFIHCAYLTKDKLQDQSVENFVAANKAISDRVLVAIDRMETHSVFTLSSGAVYKKGTHTLDTDLQANAYGVMKVRDEKRFAEIAARKKIPLAMPRLFNLSGPFINKHDSYALASMIKMVQAVQPITIRAAHNVVRSYIHVADLLTLSLSMLLDPQPDDTGIFDTAGEDVLEMADLAEYIRKVLGKPQLAIERPPRVEGRDDIYVGDATAMYDMLAQRAMILRDIRQQIRDTADYLMWFSASNPAR
jgi:nucleoside-diphosphate-sugar epimerase